MNGTAIVTQDLTVFYDHRGIQDINQIIKREEIFRFLGPNGAGKINTRYDLLEVIPPTCGRVTISGLDSIKDGFQIRERTGYLKGEYRHYLE